MKNLNPLIYRTSQSVARRDFEPFPSIISEKWLSRILEEVSVRAVTAVDYACDPEWNMRERRIGDDMLFYITKGRGQAIIEGRREDLLPCVCAQFRRVFARAMGVSPVQYLRRIRMERACQLLRQSDDKIEAIAAQVGYAEPAFFAHSFKKLIGVSPGRYRATHEL